MNCSNSTWCNVTFISSSILTEASTFTLFVTKKSFKFSPNKPRCSKSQVMSSHWLCIASCHRQLVAFDVNAAKQIKRRLFNVCGLWLKSEKKCYKNTTCHSLPGLLHLSTHSPLEFLEFHKNRPFHPKSPVFIVSVTLCLEAHWAWFTLGRLQCCWCSQIVWGRLLFSECPCSPLVTRVTL